MTATSMAAFVPGGLGLSAQAIRDHQLGIASGSGVVLHPVDVDDLCRCVDVSPAPPVHMRGVSPQWTVLVENWAELADLLGRERDSGIAPRTSARLREVLEAAWSGNRA